MKNLYAYDAGYADGQKWAIAPKGPPDAWHEATIHATGQTAFGLRCGLTDKAIAERGSAWAAACQEYNRGCADGLSSHE